MTKTKIALAAALFAATSSAALRAGLLRPDLANRYPSYAEPKPTAIRPLASCNVSFSRPARTLQSAPVRLQQHGNVHLQAAPVWQQRDVALPTGTVNSNDWFAVEQSDRASSPYAGGN